MIITRAYAGNKLPDKLELKYEVANKNVKAAKILKKIHKDISFTKAEIKLVFGPPYGKPFFFG